MITLQEQEQCFDIIKGMFAAHGVPLCPQLSPATPTENVSPSVLLFREVLTEERGEPDFLMAQLEDLPTLNVTEAPKREPIVIQPEKAMALFLDCEEKLDAIGVYPHGFEFRNSLWMHLEDFAKWGGYGFPDKPSWNGWRDIPPKGVQGDPDGEWVTPWVNRAA
ncbi:MAG TPA: hypothetical protein VLA04_05345 [Verrucomicrobiae bacterium]|nr:hypothetical protein [Verrucomicrobiae bacterium]